MSLYNVTDAILTVSVSCVVCRVNTSQGDIRTTAVIDVGMLTAVISSSTCALFSS